ncbi:MAG TPA: hypothetical protein VGP26_02140 [Actinophytocola sp.]|jgi:hypothetical protein|nr:hypothetical protein [Actinophytocola sp.]
MKAAARQHTRRSSRLASPAGFVLVLLLFLFMPFLSVSCDVSGTGSIGVGYNGAELASGAHPAVQVPDGLEDMARQLPGSPGSGKPPVEPGVRVLSILVAIVLAAGAALPFVPRLAHQVRQRMFGGAAVAVVAGGLMIATQAVAQSNVSGQLADDARQVGTDDVGAIIHSEVGFWLCLVVLLVIALVSVGVVYQDRIFPKQAAARGAGAAPIWRAETTDD